MHVREETSNAPFLCHLLLKFPWLMNVCRIIRELLNIWFLTTSHVCTMGGRDSKHPRDRVDSKEKEVTETKQRLFFWNIPVETTLRSLTVFNKFSAKGKGSYAFNY